MGTSQAEYLLFMVHVIELKGLTHLAIEVLQRMAAEDQRLFQEEMRLRHLIFAYFLDGPKRESVEMQLRLSAVVRLLSPEGMEHRLMILLGAPILNGKRRLALALSQLNLQRFQE
jgi:hypothetical protein